MIKLFIFDLDGTLLDSDKMIIDTFKHLYDIYNNGIYPSEDYMHSFSGPPIKITLKREFPNIDEKELLDTYGSISLLYYKDNIKLFPNVKEMIENLKKNNIKVAVVTSKSKDKVEYTFKLLNIEDLFDYVVSVNDVNNPKPSPEGVFKVMDKFKIFNKDDIVYIGDSQIDYLTAKNALIKFGLVSFSNRKLEKGCTPNYIINNFDNILKDINYDKN